MPFRCDLRTDKTPCRLDLTAMAHDYDWVIVGSGFGGSVSALRLAEKGYKVAVIEVGRRFEDKDFAKTAWNMRRYFWLPKLGLRGIMRMSIFKDVNVVSGCGVGGGSLGYANTLYRPRPAFYTDPQWDGTRRLGGRTRSALRHRRTDAGRDPLPRHRAGRSAAPPVRGQDRCRQDLLEHPGRRLLRRARSDRPRPLLRWRGPGPHRLHQVRLLHGRLPLRREEHPGQELPPLRREARSRRSSPGAR